MSFKTHLLDHKTYSWAGTQETADYVLTVITSMADA